MLWIKKAVKHPGALHRALDIPAGEKIPTDLIVEAAEHPERFKKTEAARRHLARMATLALRLRRMPHHRRRR